MLSADAHAGLGAAIGAEHIEAWIAAAGVQHSPEFGRWHKCEFKAFAGVGLAELDELPSRREPRIVGRATMFCARVGGA